MEDEFPFGMSEDGQFELFDGDSFWCARDPEPVKWKPLPPLPPPSVHQQLGWDNQQQGLIAHAGFEYRVATLGGTYARPNADPGGGLRSDTYVTFEGRTLTIQVKSATIDENGRAKFKLGQLEGARTSDKDGRRPMRYIGRADFFALAVFNEDTVITDWYLIPAERLRFRVTLTVSPGKRSYQLRSIGFDPERFREAWAKLLGVPSSPRETWRPQKFPTGNFHPRTEE